MEMREIEIFSWHVKKEKYFIWIAWNIIWAFEHNNLKIALHIQICPAKFLFWYTTHQPPYEKNNPICIGNPHIIFTFRSIPPYESNMKNHPPPNGGFALCQTQTKTEWITEVMSQAAKEVTAGWNLTAFILTRMTLHACTIFMAL